MNIELRLVPLCLLALFCITSTSNAATLIRVKGSDTMIHVAQAWAEAYEDQGGDVAVSVGGGGSGAGFRAMLIGTADLVNASRRIDTEEA